MKDIKLYIIGILLSAILYGCCRLESPTKDDCKVDEQARKVLLLYSAGNNSLSSYLLEDIRDLKKGWLPGDDCNDNILLVYSHTPKKNSSYNTPSTPYLIRIYKDNSGNTISDTLKTYAAGTISSSAAQLNEVLTYVKEEFTSGSYGMIFSSHGTGYLPAGFYTNPTDYTFSEPLMQRSSHLPVPSPVPYIEPDFDPSLPMVKSIGQDISYVSGDKVSYEIELSDFAEAIPMKLDYIIFDTCLMGGIEVAYELKDKCDKLVFSQTEVLAEGMVYPRITEHLLKNEKASLEDVCVDYFSQYASQSGAYQSATISLIDCSRLEPLAATCRKIFSSHRDELAQIEPSSVQRFFRSNYHWFYDLESIIRQAGSDEEELKELRDALDQCVILERHTKEFMMAFDILSSCGLSMYLPCNGNLELDKFYKTLQWNIATGLVE